MKVPCFLEFEQNSKRELSAESLRLGSRPQAISSLKEEIAFKGLAQPNLAAKRRLNPKSPLVLAGLGL